MLDMGREPTTGPLGAPVLRRPLHSEPRDHDPTAVSRVAPRWDQDRARDDRAGTGASQAIRAPSPASAVATIDSGVMVFKILPRDFTVAYSMRIPASV